MKTTAIALFLCALGLMSTSCRPLDSSDQGAKSGLSSVSLGDFKPEAGAPAWKSGRLSFQKSGSAKVELSLNFTVDKTSLEASVPYGNYEVKLEYYSDASGSTLLYKSCQDDPQKPSVYGLFAPEVELKIDICDAKGNAIGTTTGSSNVTIKPVLRKSAGTTPSVPPVAMPAPAAAGDAVKGAQILADTCATCHAPSANFGPLLDKSKADDATFERAKKVTSHKQPVLDYLNNSKADLIAALLLK